ncbi:MAG: hypothetical protein ACRBK7_19615 [Acidimicrobiales bacterium]
MKVRFRGTLLALLLALAGCSSTSSDAGTTPTSPATAPVASTATTVAPTTSTSTTLAPTTTTEIPAPDGLRHLVSAHNDSEADRINLIIAPWGWDDLEAFDEVARMFVGWDEHAQLYDDNGMPTASPQDALWGELGLFGWEPFRSNKNRFNVWITDFSPVLPAGWLNNNEPEPIELTNASFVTLALDPYSVVPGINSVAGQDLDFFGPDPQRLSDDPVANSMVLVNSSFPAGTMRDLPHELGHALFGLADEYVGRNGGDDAGVARDSFWPSCAADLETAEAWWGDRIGEIDPMVRIWADELAAVGFVEPEERIEQLEVESTVDFIEGGCHGDPGSYRIVDNTMMGYNGPGFGLANTVAAQNILDLFEGS